MFYNNPRIGQELLDVPMGEMIEQMAMSIAKAQMALDKNSIEVAEMMGGLKAITDEKKDSEGNTYEVVTFSDSRVFFGKEKVTLKVAADLYNSNTDQTYRQSLSKILEGKKENEAYDKEIINVKFSDVDSINDFDTATFTPNITKNPNYYYKADDTFYQFNSIQSVYEEIGTPAVITGKIAVKPEYRDVEVFIPQRLSMLELGFTPTFYQFVDTIIKVCISIKFTREGSSKVDFNNKYESTRRNFWGRKTSVVTSQVNASYSQKFSYSAEGSSLLQTKLVPIPPPAILEERIQLQMEVVRQQNELE